MQQLFWYCEVSREGRNFQQRLVVPSVIVLKDTELLGAAIDAFSEGIIQQDISVVANIPLEYQ